MVTVCPPLGWAMAVWFCPLSWAVTPRTPIATAMAALPISAAPVLADTHCWLARFAFIVIHSSDAGK
jgi:hypothetical protein